MKVKLLEYKKYKKAISLLLSVAMVVGYLPLSAIEAEAQDVFTGFKLSNEVSPIKTIPMYNGNGQIALDSDGFVWGNTVYSGAKDVNNSTPSTGTPLNRIRGIDKPIRDISVGQDGFNLAVSTDNKTLYIFGSSGYKTLGGAATKINDNVYKYDFFEKQGVTIVDMTAAPRSGYVVDSKGDIWTFGWEWEGRGGSGQAPNKIAGSTIAVNHAKNTNGTLDGKFTMIDAPEYFDGQYPTVIATTNKGEIFMWGYNYTPGRIFNSTSSTTGYEGSSNTYSATGSFNAIFGTTDKNGKAYKSGVPIEIDNSSIIAAEGGSLPDNPYKELAGGRGGFILTKTGHLYYAGATGYIDYGMASGLGNSFAPYGTAGKFAYTPQQITQAFDIGQASNATPSLDAKAINFIDIDSAFGGSTALDDQGNVYQVGENWRTSTDAPTVDNYTHFVKYKPRTSLVFASSAPFISDYGKIVEINTSRQATDYIVYNSTTGEYRSYTTGMEGPVYDATYNTTETGKIDFIIEGVLFKGVKGTGNVTKNITGGTSVLDKNVRLYSETGVDKAGVTPSAQLEVTMSADKKTPATGIYSEMALSMSDNPVNNNSSMRYVVVQPTNPNKYGSDTYYDLAVKSLDESLLPTYLKDKAAITTSEIPVEAFEIMYADGSITEKGTMTRTSTGNNTTDSTWKTSGSVSGNSMVIACAKTTRNGFDYYSTMAFPIDNYYKQTKSYYKGVASTNAYAGTINIFGAKAIPGQYGVFVDAYNNPITYDSTDDGVDNPTYQPPNGTDTTPDLSAYATSGDATFGGAGSYLTSPAVSPKLKYWTPDTATKTQTLPLNPTNSDTPYSVLEGSKADVKNTLTYTYSKNADWKGANVHYGYHNGSATNGWIDISNQPGGQEAITESGSVLMSGSTGNEKFWPNTTGSYSDGGDVFTPAPLNDKGVDVLKLSLVGYKIGSEPTSETDYTKCNFAYDPLTGEFDFNPIVPSGSGSSTDLYLVYKTDTVALYENYLNGDAYFKANPTPSKWDDYNLATAGNQIVPATPLSIVTQKEGINTSGEAVTTESVSFRPSYVGIDLQQGSTANGEFYEIDRIAGGNGLDSNGNLDPSYMYKNYFNRQASTATINSYGEYTKPITQIPNHILVGYFDETGAMHSFWDQSSMSFVTPNKITTANVMGARTDLNLIYLTDSNYNSIPDVLEGSVEERWVAVTSSGSKVLMNRKFTTGYKGLESYTSYETNFAPGSQWIYKSTETSTNGVTDTGSSSGAQLVPNLAYVDDQPTAPDSTPKYNNGKYEYAGGTGFRTVTYYYNEDSNENGVIDIVEPIKVTVKGVNEDGKELYSWPIESSYSEAAFTIDAMQLPTYTTTGNPKLVDSKGVIDIVNSSQVNVTPSKFDKTATESDRTLVVTFVYKETLSTLTVNQYNLNGDKIGSFVTTVDYTKPYNVVVPAVNRHTFNALKTTDPEDRYYDADSTTMGGDGKPTYYAGDLKPGKTAYDANTDGAKIPAYANGKITFSNLGPNGTANKNELNLYYSEDTGNITLYAVDIDTVGTPIIIGSTTNRKIENGQKFSPDAEGSAPTDFEIPAISNYNLKAVSTSSPYNSSFTLTGTDKATDQTFDGTTPLKSVYYFYTRKSGSIVSQAFLENGTTPINALDGSAIATVYDSEVGQTESVTPPTNSALRNYVLVGVIDSKGNRHMGDVASSVYVADDTEEYLVKFLFRPLDASNVLNIAYVDLNNDREYNGNDYLISQRVLNMLKDESVELPSPSFLGFEFEESYAYGRGNQSYGGTSQKLTIPKSNDTTVNVDSSRDGTVYFRYSQLTNKVKLRATATDGKTGVNSDITSSIPANQATQTVTHGFIASIYAPNIPGYYLVDSNVKNTATAVKDDSQEVFFEYAPIEDIAKNYMATVTVKGVNTADDSVLYEYDVYASKNGTYEATAVNLPTYSVDAKNKSVDIAYTDDNKEIVFNYTTLLEGATAYFYDEVTGTYFAPSQEIVGAMKNNPITQRAYVFNNYNNASYYYVGYSNTKPTGSGDTVNPSPVGKIDNVSSTNNAIYFHYKKFVNENIKVYYVEDNGSADPRTMDVIQMSYDSVPTNNGATKDVSINVNELLDAGYTSPSVLTQTVTYNDSKAMYEVFFVFKKQLANVEIYALNSADNSQIGTGPVKTLTNQRVAETINIEPPYVNGYDTTDSSVNHVVSVNAGDNRIYFKYTVLPQASITVNAVDVDDPTHVIGTYTVKTNVGNPIDITPLNIVGWTLYDSAEDVPKSCVVAETDTTVTYKYKKDEETVKFNVVDNHGNSLTSLLDPAVKTSFSVPKSNTELGYELNKTVYAPHINDYVLTTDSIRSFTFNETNKTQVPVFVYQHLDEVAANYMETVTVKYREVDATTGDPTNRDLFSYTMLVPRNTNVEIKAQSFDNFKLKAGEPLKQVINVSAISTNKTFTFDYISTVGQINIVHIDDDLYNQDPVVENSLVATSYEKYDAEVDAPYSYNADAVPEYYYYGYTINDPDPAKIGTFTAPGVTPQAGKVFSTAYINQVAAEGDTIYFHYKKISDKVSIHLMEVADQDNDGQIALIDSDNDGLYDSGDVRTILVTSGGSPSASYNYSWNGNHTSVAGTNLDGILDDEYYVLDNTNYADYGVLNSSFSYDFDGMSAKHKDIYFYFKKETRTITLNVEDEEGNIVATQDEHNVRLGEYTKFTFPAATNFVNVTRTQGVYVTRSTADTLITTALYSEEHGYTIQYVNYDKPTEVLQTIEVGVLNGQDTVFYPNDKIIGWKLVDSSGNATTTNDAAVPVTGGENPNVIKFMYKKDVQPLTVRYQYTNPHTGEVKDLLPENTSISTPNTNNAIPYYMKEVVIAKSIPGYVLIASSTDDGVSHTFTTNDAVNNYVHTFKYKKITDVLDEYTVQVNVIGKGFVNDDKGVQTTSELYKYTLTLPAETTVFENDVNIIKTQSVPDKFVLSGLPVVENDGKNVKYVFDGNTTIITETLDATNGLSDNVVTITYNYVYNGSGEHINIRAIEKLSDGTVNVLASNTVFALNSTAITGFQPTVTGYDIVATEPATRIGIVGTDTNIDFEFIPQPTKDATVHFLVSGVEKGSEVVQDIKPSESTRFNVPDSFIADGNIYKLAKPSDKYLIVVGGQDYNVDYVFDRKAIQTITTPGSSGNTVYITKEKPVYVEKEVVVYDNTRENQPIKSDMLRKGSELPYASGYPDDTFKPNDSITRAEVAVMFYNLSTDSNKTDKIANRFSDVDSEIWYAQAVNYLASIGILEGYGNGEFRPNETITRAEFTAITSRFDDLVQGSNNNFPDVPSGHWAADAINSGYARGWIDGYPSGYFVPNGKITRAETVTIINRMVDRSGKNVYTQADNKFRDVSPEYWAFQDIVESSISYAK